MSYINGYCGLCSILFFYVLLRGNDGLSEQIRVVRVLERISLFAFEPINVIVPSTTTTRGYLLHDVVNVTIILIYR